MKKNQITILIFIAFWGLCLPFQGVLASEISKDSVIDLVNKSRKSVGIGSLEENGNLSLAALEKADDMLEKDYFSHTSPGGVTPWYWIEKSGYDYKYAGENLAINFYSPEKQHEAWMESPEHRKNILNSRFEEIGVAVKNGIIDGEQTTITVQMFGSQDELKESQLSSNTKPIILSNEKNKIADENKDDRENRPIESILVGRTSNNSPGGTGKSDVYELMQLVALSVIIMIIFSNPIIIAFFLAGYLIKEDEEDEEEKEVGVKNIPVVEI